MTLLRISSYDILLILPNCWDFCKLWLGVTILQMFVICISTLTIVDNSCKIYFNLRNWS